MQLAAHFTLQRGVDHLVLLDPAFARKGRRNDCRGIVVSVTPQVLDCHLGVRKRLFDHGFNVSSAHGHSGNSNLFQAAI